MYSRETGQYSSTIYTITYKMTTVGFRLFQF